MEYYGAKPEIQTLGTKPIPQRGGLIVISNHLSHLDTSLLLEAIGRNDTMRLLYNMNFRAYSRYDEGGLLVNADDWKAGLDTIVQHVGSGGSVLIFPSRDRERDGREIEFGFFLRKLLEKCATRDTPHVQITSAMINPDDIAPFRPDRPSGIATMTRVLVGLSLGSPLSIGRRTVRIKARTTNANQWYNLRVPKSNAENDAPMAQMYLSQFEDGE